MASHKRVDQNSQPTGLVRLAAPYVRKSGSVSGQHYELVLDPLAPGQRTHPVGTIDAGEE